MRFYFVTYLICLLIVLRLFFDLTINFKEGYIIVKWLNWKGCHKHNVYGADCNVPCPRNCKNNTCHIHNGTCLECNPGWTGPFCSNSTIKAIFKLWPYDDQKIFLKTCKSFKQSILGWLFFMLFPFSRMCWWEVRTKLPEYMY